MLSACGFHLRGNVPLPPGLSPIYIETASPYDPFIQTLEETLTHRGIALAESPKDASTTLHIIRLNLAENLNSVSASTNTRQYTLVYSVEFELLGKKGQILLPQAALSTSSPVTVNSSQVLSTSSEEQTIKQEMQQRLVQQLMARLGAENTRKALKYH